MLTTLWQTVWEGVNRGTEWEENAVRKVWCQQGQLVAQPAARQGWNLRLVQPHSQAEGGGRGKETQVGEREWGIDCPPRRKKAKYAGSRQGTHVRKCTRRERQMEQYWHDRLSVGGQRKIVRVKLKSVSVCKRNDVLQRRRGYVFG